MGRSNSIRGRRGARLVSPGLALALSVLLAGLAGVGAPGVTDISDLVRSARAASPARDDGPASQSGAATSAKAPDWVRLLPAGELGGRASAVAVADGRAYLGVGRGLDVLDIRDPARPRAMGHLGKLAGAPTDLVVAGRIAFVAAERFGLYVVDITEPSAPREIGVFAPADAASLIEPRLAVDGPRLYIAGQQNGLYILDVSRPEAPALVRQLTGIFLMDVAADGGKVWLVMLDNGLVIVDLSNPVMPTLLGQAFFGSGRRIELDGPLAYLAVESRLVVLDTTDLQRLQVRSHFFTGDTILSLAIWGDLVAVSIPDGLVQLLRRGDGLLLQPEADITLPGPAFDLVSGAPGLYVADGTGGLQVVDLAVTTAPRISGTYETFSPSSGLALTGQRLQLGTPSGFIGVDVTDPARARMLAPFTGAGETQDVATDGRFAFRAFAPTSFAPTDAERPGVEIVDISGPTPRLEAVFRLSAPPQRLLARAGKLYVVAGQGLRIVDLADPRRPFEAGALRLPVQPRTLAVDEGLVLTTGDGDGSVVLVDARDPQAPRIAGLLTDKDFFALDAALRDGRAYIVGTSGDGSAALRVMDVSDPAVPRLLGSLGLIDTPLFVTLAGHTAYITHVMADDGGGVGLGGGGGGGDGEFDANLALTLVDVSDPMAPRAMDRYAGLSQALVDGDRAYARNGWGGLSIFHVLAGPRLFLPVALTGLLAPPEAEGGESR